MANSTKRTIFFVSVILIAGVVSAPASDAQHGKILTPKSTAAREYAACMALARSKPKAAHESALAWRKKGGGDAAIHCIAVSLLGLGQYSQAARMLEELADQPNPKRPDLRAGLYGQSANAWNIAGRPQTAAKLLTKAIKLQPDNLDLLIDRSIAHAGLGQYWKSLDDLNLVVEKAPDNADALIFRASAWRKVGTLDLAEQDIVAALALKPDDPDGLLERGLIRKAQGEIAAARKDWLRVLEISVEGPLTEAARRNLETIDVRK
ncbi:MAG: tetratricopeptide repeat protein [Alphaproteobacteria bacterium]|nr:tetratricopeptide repeat protein [Alphaproteobacteria bacterium]